MTRMIIQSVICSALTDRPERVDSSVQNEVGR